MEQEILNSILFKRNNIFITGPGGTGKSHLIKNIVKELNQKNINVGVTASTGVAAINVKGVTIHSYFGVGVCKGEFEKILTKIKKNYKAKERIRNTSILFIDEISMIGKDFFTTLNNICKCVRGNSNFFGGIKLVISGDFLQLPPINDDWVFKSESWNEGSFTPFFLNVPYRYIDKSFYLMLMRAREGYLFPKDIKQIESRVKAYEDYLLNKEQYKVKPTIIYSLKYKVDELNIKEMEKLKHPLFTYISQDSIITKDDNIKIKNYEKILNDYAPQHLNLKIGTQVMLTVNLDLDKNLCNGTRGVIKDLDDNVIVITTKNDSDIIIERYPFILEEKEFTITRSQFPLILAYAITIHKSQGSTIDFCIIDLSSEVFEYGQAYVALSRTRCWNSLLVNTFSRKSIKANKEALNYISKLEEFN